MTVLLKRALHKWAGSEAGDGTGTLPVTIAALTPASCMARIQHTCLTDGF